MVEKKLYSTTFPTSWGNITGQELCFFEKERARLDTTMDDEQLKKMALEQILESCARKFYKADVLPNNLPALNKVQMAELKKLLLFLLTETTLTRNLFPTIKIGDVIYYGPADALTNARFWEFLKANQHYINFLKKKREEDLNNFMAVLYRPAKKDLDVNAVTFDGDKRELYNDTICEKRAAHFKKVDYGIKKVTTLYFTGSSHFLKNRFGDAFEEGGKPNEFGVHGVIDNMAGNKWGKTNEVKQTLLYEVLIGACQAAKKAEELKAKYGSN